MGIIQRIFGRSHEKRSSGMGYTAEIMAARESYLAGRSGLGELTATVQTCVSLWESAFSAADVTGAPMLTRPLMAMVGRSLALRGEAVLLVRDDQLVPCADWDVRTLDGVPRAYRVTVSEAGGGRSETVLAGEVLHVRIGSDPVAPWSGTAPLRRAALSAGLLHAVETVLSETWEVSPIGSQVVPMPESPETDNTALGRSFRGQRGRVLLRESVQVTAAGGPAPATDWRPAGLTPDLRGLAHVETMAAARDAVCNVFGVLPALVIREAQGPAIREAQRHLATWMLQPIAELIAAEASEKLAANVAIDVLRPLQAFDSGGAARALGGLVAALSEAKTNGLDDATLASLWRRLDWET